MKNKLAKILCIIMILNFIMPRAFVIAYPNTIDSSIDESPKDVVDNMDPNLTNSLLESGEAPQHPASGEANGDSYEVETTWSQLISTPFSSASSAGTLAGIINVFPAFVTMILSLIVNLDNQTEIRPFTIQDTVLGKFDLFSIDFFEPEEGESQVNKALKKQVAIWYYGIRNLAVAILLCALIYTGIRMAASTTAVDKATYKKRLIDWATGVFIIFFMHYIMLFAVNISSVLVQILPEPGDNLETVIMQGKEDEDGIRKKIADQKGWNLVFTCVLFWMIVYYQVKFFYVYIKRVAMTGFLLIISPIICVYYAIGMRKPYKFWMKELIVNILIQPLHAVLYLVFITSASQIAEVAPLLAVLFFGALSRGEKIVKNIFNMRGLRSINSLGTYQFKGKK